MARHRKKTKRNKTPPVLCATTGKHQHPTYERAASVALRSSRRAGHPLRIYPCPHGKHWHLTKRIETRPRASLAPVITSGTHRNTGLR